jgi:hypothetical protein
MVIASSTAWAQNEIKQQPIELPAQGKTASFKGKINGYESVDYIFKAKPRQKLQIDLKTASTSAYFNLLQDGIDEALHIGSVAGSHFGGTLPSAGDYRIRVYLMRSAARKKASANYQVDLRVDR